MDELLKQWRKIYDERELAAADIEAQIDVLNSLLCEAVTPYNEQLAELQEKITAAALEKQATTKAHGVVVSYRKGYERVSYEYKRVDAILAFLKDALPETAKSLEVARSVKAVAPSVTVKADA